MSPRIFLIGRPHFTDAHQAFLEAFLPPNDATWKQTQGATAAEKLVEFAGRVCYMSFGSHQSPKSTREYIHNLIRNGHDSVLEHATWTIALMGVSRAFTHQLVRHRVGFAFSQLSQQYHDESEARFIRPPGIDEFPDVSKAWDKTIGESQRAYRNILKTLRSASDTSAALEKREVNRALRSAARSVLPNATETAIVVTANARALRHFLSVRGNIVGDTEMRCVAASLLQLLSPEAPSLFSDYFVERYTDRLPIVRHRPLSKK